MLNHRAARVPACSLLDDATQPTSKEGSAPDGSGRAGAPAQPAGGSGSGVDGRPEGAEATCTVAGGLGDHHHHHHRHSHHHAHHRHSSLAGPAEAAASEAPAAWQRQAGGAPPLLPTLPPIATGKQPQQAGAPAADADGFPSPPPRPRAGAGEPPQPPGTAAPAAAGGARPLVAHASQGSGSGVFNDSNTGPNGSNGERLHGC